jgi:hypothetical protein
LSEAYKPFGRKSYTIITGGGGYIDISIIPPKKEVALSKT